jgi:hypothetical protein
MTTGGKLIIFPGNCQKIFLGEMSHLLHCVSNLMYLDGVAPEMLQLFGLILAQTKSESPPILYRITAITFSAALLHVYASLNLAVFSL